MLMFLLAPILLKIACPVPLARVMVNDVAHRLSSDSKGAPDRAAATWLNSTSVRLDIIFEQTTQKALVRRRVGGRVGGHPVLLGALGCASSLAPFSETETMHDLRVL